jgi:hypothetical protein
MITITVIRAPYRKGYSLQHNGPIGFMGTTRSDGVFGWYKYETDAQLKADELNKHLLSIWNGKA